MGKPTFIEWDEHLTEYKFRKHANYLISAWALVQSLSLILDSVWSVLLISCYCDFPTRMDYNLRFKAQISSSTQVVFMRVLLYSIGKQSQQAEDFIT